MSVVRCLGCGGNVEVLVGGGVNGTLLHRLAAKLRSHCSMLPRYQRKLVLMSDVEATIGPDLCHIHAFILVLPVSAVAPVYHDME